MLDSIKHLVAIIHPEGNVNNNPSLRSIVDSLLNAGYIVHYFSAHDVKIPYQHVAGEEATFFYYHVAFLNFPVVTKYSAVFAVDSGIILGKNIAQTCACPLIMISYEIMCDADLKTPVEWKEKQNIKDAASYVKRCIVQDVVRGELLAKEYGIAQDNMLYIPVAPKKSIPYVKSSYLHVSLNIPKEKKILLHFGSIEEWSMVHWAVKNALTLPSDWVIVIHSRYGEVCALKDLPKNCYISSKALPPNDLHKLVQSAQCTMALYTPTGAHWSCGKNIEDIGLASGKIATSLAYGVPVLTNSTGEIGRLLRKYKAGIIIDTKLSEPFSVLQDFLDNKSYAQHCTKLFEAELSFANYADPFLQMISEECNKNACDDVFRPACCWAVDYTRLTRQELIRTLKSVAKELLKRFTKKLSEIF